MVCLDLNCIGIDEVGYGCWAGPLFICALKFVQYPDFELFDSKKISAAKRELLYEKILAISTYQLGIATVQEINDLGLSKAYKLGLNRAIRNMKGKMFIDGNTNRGIGAECIIKGDQKIAVISAASIVAKVSRDRLMQQLGLQYKEYGFEKHKGYGTKLHKLAIQQHGFCKEHRIFYKIKF